ncbi:MAG: hypothetical protein P1V20_26545 [Verrucomicrobiales bacterium]|nr:hypothetical protein [Verrucomicrobiales bacterium]
MLLILSSKIVSEELAQQFGRIPPALLPFGAGRLIESQIHLADRKSIYLTLPAGYELSAFDAEQFSEYEINVIRLPETLSVTEAISEAICIIKVEGAIQILYGDTLVQFGENRALEPDSLTIANDLSNYPWAFVDEKKGDQVKFSNDPPEKLINRKLVCGYFYFSDARLLAKVCATRSFVDALNAYGLEKNLELVVPEKWFDFGHLPLFFDSRKSALTSRYFNDVRVEDEFVYKTSPKTTKIRNESRWFEGLPVSMRPYVPRYGGLFSQDQKAGYALEYVHAPGLSDLFVFGELGVSGWLEIFQSCKRLLNKFHNLVPASESPEASPGFAELFHDEMLIQKSSKRLDTFFEQSNLGWQTEFKINGRCVPNLESVLSDCLSSIPESPIEAICFWHGDLFFGNMFYDFLARRILCIDPRAEIPEFGFSQFGDKRYDIAKLCHSVIGKYDKIVGGRARINITGQNTWEWDLASTPNEDLIENIFWEMLVDSFCLPREAIVSLTAILFFSMLPFHIDDMRRQRMLLSAGFRLHEKLVSQKIL